MQRWLNERTRGEKGQEHVSSNTPAMQPSQARGYNSRYIANRRDSSLYSELHGFAAVSPWRRGKNRNWRPGENATEFFAPSTFLSFSLARFSSAEDHNVLCVVQQLVALSLVTYALLCVACFSCFPCRYSRPALPQLQDGRLRRFLPNSSRSRASSVNLQ